MRGIFTFSASKNRSCLSRQAGIRAPGGSVGYIGAKSTIVARSPLRNQPSVYLQYMAMIICDHTMQ